MSAPQALSVELSKTTPSSLPSYDHGVVSEPLCGETIGQYFDNIAARYPDKESLVSCQQGIKLTYRQLKEKVDLCARGLMALSIERGDRVGIWSTNNAEWTITQLATAAMGAILVNINPGYRTSELEYALKQSGVKLLITIPKHRTSDYLAMLTELAAPLFGKSGESKLPDLQDIVVIGTPAELEGKLSGKLISFDALSALSKNVSEDALNERSKRLQFDDPINIQYTSGTTGFPKGVTLSHHNLINNAIFAAKAMEIDSQSRFCVPMPFYHCGGMISSSLATITMGGTVVIPSPFFEETAVLEAMSNLRCTHVSGVPTMFIAELEHPQFAKYDLTSLRSGFMAGAPCPVHLMRRVANDMHCKEIVILYGLTEASPLITATPTSESLEIRCSTVGRAIAGLEVKIIDAVTGEVVPRGVQGELCTRGHGVMLGYWNNPGATEEAIDKARWLHTGDLAVMNEQGYIKITGRKKDMIIRGGENIYPREIEEVLHSHPAIMQAQVFGIPDDHLGEEVAMWVMLKPGMQLNAEEVTAWLKERIAYFKIPRQIRFVEEFPMTVTGKIQKFEMRKLMIKELGLEAAANIETA